MPKNLLFVCQTFQDTCGWGRLAGWLVRVAIAQGYHVTCVSADKEGVLPTGAIAGPRIFDSNDSFVPKLRSALGFWRWFRTQPKDVVVHIISEHHFWLALGIRQPSIGTLHGTYSRIEQHGSKLYQLLFRLGMNRLRRLGAVSHYTQRRMTQDWREKTTVTQLGVSPHLLQEPWKPVQWQTQATHKVLCVGAIKPRKGCLELVEGFGVYAKTHPNSALTFVGDYNEHDPYIQHIKTRIQALGLTNKVLLTGSIPSEELYGWYRWCDLYAMTNIDQGGSFEGFGLVFLEANLFGKPVLGVKNTGGEEAISAETGVTIDNVQPQTIAEGLEKALSRTDWNFSPWLQEHTWERFFSEYEKIYNEVRAS